MRGPAPTQPDPARVDPSGFEALLIAHQNRIYFFIRTMVFNPDEARDVLQDVNAIIIRKRGKFADGTDFKSWSFAIARFECLAYLRRYRNRQAAPADAELSLYLSEGADPQADRIEAWLKALAECRKLLEHEADQLLKLRYETCDSLEEIAARKRTTEGALKQKLFRIRSQLRHCIEKRFPQSGGGTAND